MATNQILKLNDQFQNDNGDDWKQTAINDSCAFFFQTMFIHIKINLSGSAYVVNTTVAVTLLQIIADRVELIVLL